MATTHLDSILEQLGAECRRLQQENKDLQRGFQHGRSYSSLPPPRVSQGSHVQEVPPDLEACEKIKRPASTTPGASLALTEVWPAGVGIREVFTLGAVPCTMVPVCSTRFSPQPSLSSSVVLRDSSDKGPMAEFRARLCMFAVMHPNSKQRKLLDFVGMICMLYEMAATPYAVAWQTALEGTYLVFSCVVSAYWLCDLLLAFNTGFFDRAGQLRMARREIAWHYLPRSFFVDLSLVVSDWSIIGLSGIVGDTANSYMIVRVSRVLKALKIIRLIRLAKGVDSLFLGRVSHGRLFIATVCKIILATFLVAHVLACVWYILGRHGPSDTQHRWTMVLDDTAGSSYEYVSSMHFVIAQMTLGATDVMPVNTAERIFAASILVLAILFGSILTSYVGAMVLERVMLRRDWIMKIECLRDFLEQHKVTPRLAQQVQRQATCRLATTIPVKEKNVDALQMVSATLRLWLCYELKMPYLQRFPLFQVWKELDATALEMLCETDVENYFMAGEDDLFVPCTQAKHMYFIISGLLRYVQDPSSSRVRNRTSTEIHDGTWVCEMALWTHWYHVGRMTARCTCHMVSVNAASVEKVLRDKSEIFGITKTYANNFHDRLTVSIPPAADWPSDIQVPHTEFTDLFSPDVELELLNRALQTGEIELTEEQQTILKLELQNGTCRLQKNTTGELLKIVTAVTLCLRDDEKIFAQVGTWNPEKGIKAKVQLPGTKRQRGELPQAAVDRLLADDFADFGPQTMTFSTTEQQCQTMPSATCGMDTMYLRVVQNAVLADEMPDLRIVRSKLRPGSAVNSLGDVVVRDVFVVTRKTTKNDAALYAWVFDDELERLSQPHTAADLILWLASLEGLESLETLDPNSPASEASNKPSPQGVPLRTPSEDVAPAKGGLREPLFNNQ